MLKLLALLLLSSSALAQNCTTLQYTGAPFTSVTTTGPATTANTVVSPLTGMVILSTPLPANGTTQVTPVWWDFSAEYVALNSADSQELIPTFIFTTVNGVVTGWSVSVGYEINDADELTVSVSSSQQGDSVTMAQSNVLPPPNLGAYTSITGESFAPGSWACGTNFNTALVHASAPPEAPPVTPAPVTPTTLATKVQPNVRLWGDF